MKSNLILIIYLDNTTSLLKTKSGLVFSCSVASLIYFMDIRNIDSINSSIVENFVRSLLQTFSSKSSRLNFVIFMIKCHP